MRHLALLAILALPLAAAAPSGRFELSNDNVLLAFDTAGNVAELTNRQTGHHYVSAAAQPPWRMYYRLGTPLDGALDLEIDPAAQTAEVRRESGALVIAYKALKAAAPKRGETREIQVGLEIRVTLDGDRLTWTGRIINREPDPRLEITELWIPWIYGIGDMGLGRASDVLYWPERAGRRIQDPYTRMTAAPAPAGPGRRGETALRLTYPFPAGMQWYTFNNGEEGLYVGSHDKTLMTTCLNVMAHPDKALSASVVKYPFVKAGETWTSEPVVLRLYRGDWHVAAKTYRAWADTWMERNKPPEWLRRAPGWILALAQRGRPDASTPVIPICRESIKKRTRPASTY